MRFLITLALLAAALTAYATLVRPYLAEQQKLKSFFDRADGFWSRVLAWLKSRWDIAAGLVMIATPDLVDVLEQLRVMDLSAALAIMSETTRSYIQAAIQLSGIALPLLRAWIIRRVG